MGISFLKKSDFHLSNGVFPIFCYEISATALAGRFCVARETHDTKIEVIECQFPLCISLLCVITVRVFVSRKQIIAQACRIFTNGPRDCVT